MDRSRTMLDDTKAAMLFLVSIRVLPTAFYELLSAWRLAPIRHECMCFQEQPVRPSSPAMVDGTCVLTKSHNNLEKCLAKNGSTDSGTSTMLCSPLSR